uniref:Endonuclease/exonuclease/phosphatase domain-containing protein n=1 Tax=Octopus bimaculoides TaxID=37653 RepID=A0A0L8I499_OCTBM
MEDRREKGGVEERRNMKQRNHLTIVLGDFNVDLLDSPNHETLTTMNQFGFDQLVQKGTTDYGSLIDHVYVNQDQRPQVTVTDCYFYDHDVVCVSLKF